MLASTVPPDPPKNRAPARRPERRPGAGHDKLSHAHRGRRGDRLPRRGGGVGQTGGESEGQQYAVMSIAAASYHPRIGQDAPAEISEESCFQIRSAKGNRPRCEEGTERLVAQIFSSWNPLSSWLRQIAALKRRLVVKPPRSRKVAMTLPLQSPEDVAALQVSGDVTPDARAGVGRIHRKPATGRQPGPWHRARWAAHSPFLASNPAPE